MIKNKLNINYAIGIIIVLSLIIGFLTIQTFAGKGFIELNSLNIQILFVINLLLLSIFVSFVIYKFFNLYNERKKSLKIGSKTKIKFLLYFISLAAIPGVVIAIFSLLIFNYSIEKWFDKKINDAVNNSTEIAKRYLNEHQSSIGKDILLVANDFNRNSNQLKKDAIGFQNYIKLQSTVRSIQNIYLVNSVGEAKYTQSTLPVNDFKKPDPYILSAAKSGKPIIISSAYTNKTYGMVKLSNFEDLYIYVIQNVDPKIVNYLKKTGEVSQYYYQIKNNIFNLQVTFMIIYLIITLLLILIASVISINLSTYILKPLSALFNISSEIEKGNYNVSLDQSKNLDTDFTQLYQTFNNMISRIKEDQIKKSLEGRYDAWNIIAKKLAHEIKNPLTPIQLSLDRINDKFKNQITDGRENFDNHIKTINSQIKEINTLINSFSDFARMPDPVFDKTDIIKVIKKSVMPYEANYPDINFDINANIKEKKINIDENQIFRLFTNLVKNSVESINEKQSKNGKIIINITEDNKNIIINLTDNGLGFKINQINKNLEPYYTTKAKGSGLGLSIVSKIIFEHGGHINFSNNSKHKGAVINFTISKKL
jgi:two-component system, NtrC family, nitrogen regulation sensor histidine kinase NtrY